MSDAEALGSELREARQGRDLTLDQVEQQIRIRAKFLEALEQGNYAALPSPVQARGFLRNYARFLGLDGDLMVSRYDAALQGGRRRGRRAEPGEAPLTPTSAPRRTQTVQIQSPPSAPYVPPPPPAVVEKPERRRSRSWLTTLVIGLFGLAIFAVVLLFGVQGLQSFLAQNASGSVILSPLPREASPTAPVTNTPAPTATPVRPTPLPIPNAQPTAAAASGVTVQLQITERTWIRVIVDGQVSYIGSAAPNSMLQYQGNSVQVRAANAVGVHAVVNGQDLGILGARGQIVDQTFTAGGTIQASPTAPPRPAANSPNTSGAASVKPVSTSPQATFSLTPTGKPLAYPTSTPLPTFPPTPTDTLTPTITKTPTPTTTPTITLTPSLTSTPTLTRTSTNTPTPTITFTPSMTFTPSNTPLFLPRETSTPEGGETRPK